MATAGNDELYAAVLRCIKCGFCQAQCPTYKELREESACARGRIRLFRAVLEGEQTVSESYREALDRCTSCMACSTACPGGVDPYRLILQARANAVKSRGLPTAKSLGLRTILAREEIHGLAFAAASTAQRMGLTHLVPRQLVPDGLDVSRFPVAGLSFRRRIREVSRAQGSRTAEIAEGDSPLSRTGRRPERAAFFVGCMIDHSLPQVGRATVRVLNAVGVEVVVPKKLKCCGFPLIVSGDPDAARTLAEHNLKILRALSVDHVITSCPTCGSALKHEWPRLLETTPLAEAARTVADKAIDVSSFLAPRIDRAELRPVELRATYHDPCHLLRGLGVSAEPRALVQRVPGVAYTEMNEADRCCGAGGVFQLFFPEVARGITQRKLDNVRETEAEVVVSPCPACLQRLQGGLQRHGMPQTTMHLVELLEKAL